MQLKSFCTPETPSTVHCAYQIIFKAGFQIISFNISEQEIHTRMKSDWMSLWLNEGDKAL